MVFAGVWRVPFKDCFSVKRREKEKRRHRSGVVPGVGLA